VVFPADLSAGGYGIFSGPDPVANELFATGIPLLGTTTVGGFFAVDENNSGQIVFLATLANNDRVLVRADPATTAVPQPSSLALLCVGGLSLGAGHWLRRQARP
jgi:hypothetical protein